MRKVRKVEPRVLSQAKIEAKIGPTKLSEQCHWVGRRDGPGTVVGKEGVDGWCEGTLSKAIPQTGRPAAWLFAFQTGSLLGSTG